MTDATEHRVVDSNVLLERLEGLHEDAGAAITEGNVRARAIGWAACIVAVKNLIFEIERPA